MFASYLSHFARRNDWQTLSRNGGGVLNNTCVHFLDQILQLVPGKVAQVFGDLQHIASAGRRRGPRQGGPPHRRRATADLEISTAENVALPLPKWILCGTHGTLTNEGSESTIRFFDPKQVRPLQVIDGPAQDRKYGNIDELPWQERTIQVPGRVPNAFYDNVYDVLRNGGAMHVTPQSVREVMRVLALIRKSATTFSCQGR